MPCYLVGLEQTKNGHKEASDRNPYRLQLTSKEKLSSSFTMIGGRVYHLNTSRRTTYYEDRGYNPGYKPMGYFLDATLFAVV